MEILSGVVMVILTIHFFLLISTNQWRIKKLVTFVDKFRYEGLLAKKDYEHLYDRYTSFLSYMEFFPNKQDYRLLYENKEFDKFVTRTRKRLTYYAIVTAICFALLAVLSVRPAGTESALIRGNLNHYRFIKDELELSDRNILVGKRIMLIGFKDIL